MAISFQTATPIDTSAAYGRLFIEPWQLHVAIYKVIFCMYRRKWGRGEHLRVFKWSKVRRQTELGLRRTALIS